MPRHTVDVQQLKSDGDSYLNVDAGMGWVKVETYLHKRPTLLLRRDNNLALIQFDDEAWMNDWIAANDIGWTIEHLDDVSEREKVGRLR
jgi:hypothetical protein